MASGHDPEERDRRDVGGEVRRHAEHQAGRDGREEHPAGAPGGGDRPVRAAGLGVGERGHRPPVRGVRRGIRQRPRPGRPRPTVGRARSPEREGAAGGEHDEDPVAPRPQAALGVQADEALDEHRVREERQHAADVARGVEHVRVRRGWVARRREPGLEHGAGRRDGEEGQPDRDGEEGEEPGDGIRVARRDPARRQRDRQRQERQEQDEEVETGLPARPRASAS